MAHRFGSAGAGPGARSNPAPVRSASRLRSMRIGIVGLGYVGLPLAVAFCEAGHAVVGYDTDSRRVERLIGGQSEIEDVPAERLAALGLPRKQ